MTRLRHITPALAAMALGLAGSGPARAGGHVTFVSQGGAYQQAQTRAILDPAAERLGISIDQDSAPDAWPIIRTQEATGAPTWDVVDTPTFNCLRGGEQGLIAKLDFTKIPNAAAMPDAYKSPYSVAYEFYSSVLAYNRAKFGAHPPQSWADFWNVTAFPGRRALRNYPLGTLEAALMADGVPPDQLYPLDVDRAFRKLAEIRPHITVWWTSGGQSAQLLHDGEVDMLMAWNGRVSAVAAQGADVAFTYNQGLMQNTSLCILNHAPDMADAVRFLNEAISPDLQAHLPLEIDYGPGNPAAFDTGVIPAKRAAELPSAPANAAKQALISAQWWASPQGTGAERRWLAFMQQ